MIHSIKGKEKVVHRYQPTRSQASLRTPGLYKLWAVFTEETELFSYRNCVWDKKTTYNTCSHLYDLSCLPSQFILLLSPQQTANSKQVKVHSNSSVQGFFPACHFFSRFSSRYTLKLKVLTSECVPTNPSNSNFIVLRGRLLTLHSIHWYHWKENLSSTLHLGVSHSKPSLISNIRIISCIFKNGVNLLKIVFVIMEM